MDKTIEMFTTTISDEAIANTLQCLTTTRLSAGAKADSFEKALTQKFGLPNPVTVNSGTVTMHLALVAAGVGPGDEVILPAQTFIATGMAVLYVGAKPVFADINIEDGNISTESIRKKITNRTKAIIPVHWGGYPCDLDEINQIAIEYNLAVIEDAAHAFGALYRDKYIGTISRFTSFSFQAIKHLTTGDGGALCCLGNKDAQLVRRLRWFDIDRESSTVGILGEREYDAINIGYKYHMNDIAASVGLGNLKTIDDKLERVREIANYYNSQFANIDGIKLPTYKDDRKSSYWLYPMFVDKRVDFIKKMLASNIKTSVVHIGIDKNTIFGGTDYSLLNQRMFDATQIHIPIHNDLSDEEVNIIINTIKSGW